MTPLKFFMFYSIFLGFTLFITTMAGVSIYSNLESVSGLIPTTALDFINPLFIGGAMWALFNISTEFAIIYAITIVPFLIGLVYIMASWVRGVSP